MDKTVRLILGGKKDVNWNKICNKKTPQNAIEFYAQIFVFFYNGEN